MMLVANDEYAVGPNGRWSGGGPADAPGFRGAHSCDAGGRAASDACLLWCLRRLVLVTPLGTARCDLVHIALQRQFADCGLGIEHLLRCLVMGLAMHSSRRLAIGLPGCPLRTDDETALIALITGDVSAGRDTATGLAGIGGAAAAVLQPLVEALRDLQKPGG